MALVPKGYVALTASHDGSRLLLDARGLVVCPAQPMHRAGSKLPDGCVVGPINDTDSYWIVAESFDEVCAKLVAALGDPECDTAANALRDAARDFVGHRSGDDEWTADDVRAWLRSRAAVLEGGAS